MQRRPCEDSMYAGAAAKPHQVHIDEIARAAGARVRWSRSPKAAPLPQASPLAAVGPRVREHRSARQTGYIVRVYTLNVSTTLSSSQLFETESYCIFNFHLTFHYHFSNLA